MEKVCTISIAVVIGSVTVYATRLIGVTHSSSVILGVLLGLYGLWLGKQLYIKIHHH